MGGCRGSVGVALPSWLLASFATAVISHALICSLAGHDATGNAYGDRGHVAVTPVALSTLSLAVALLLRSALRVLSRSHGVDPIAKLGRSCAEVCPLLPSLSVAAGGFATLLAMECCEQLVGLRRIEGLDAALGGTPVLSFAIVAVVAALVTVVALRSAAVLLSTAVAAVGALISWFVANARSLDHAIVKRLQRHRTICAPAFSERCFGTRAPPLPALA
jgi:hypothetical protein